MAFTTILIMQATIIGASFIVMVNWKNYTKKQVSFKDCLSFIFLTIVMNILVILSSSLWFKLYNFFHH